VRDILVFFITSFLIILLGIVVYFFYRDFYLISNIFAKIGSGIILFFTILVLSRYMLMLFFSMLKTIFKTADENNPKNIIKHRITIIIPAYNEEAVIASSIESLLKQTYSNMEILVVDDGSKDNTYTIAKRFVHNRYNKVVRPIRKANGGKSSAINEGIKHSTGELIMVVDADSKLKSDAVELMQSYFTDPQIAAVAGSVFVINKVNMITKLQALEYIEGLNMIRNGQALVKLVNIIPGPIGMFRKDALYEVGLYDSDTFAEDCDVTLKLIAKGYKIDFESDALAYTEAPEALLDLIKQRYRWTRGILQAIKKHKNMLFNFRINPSASLTLWYMMFEGVFWPFIDAWTNIFIIYLALTSGVSILIFYWWVMFAIVDMAGAFYCLLITGEDLTLMLYAIYYRLFFISIVNIAKILSTIEEWFGIEMNWGKLDRKGRL
jgi:cellulose synthase/poly-beta-1,6-N-acetylglucosamine synthase-like glycosyltransferase